MLHLAQGKEISKFDWILSKKSVLEDFTLWALVDFNKCTNTCGNQRSGLFLKWLGSPYICPCNLPTWKPCCRRSPHSVPWSAWIIFKNIFEYLQRCYHKGVEKTYEHKEWRHAELFGWSVLTQFYFYVISDEQTFASYASSKLRPTNWPSDWRECSVELLA